MPSGGHNILEPASFGQPPVFGPSMENFQDMADQFLDGHAAMQVSSAAQPGKVWIQLIENRPLRTQIGNLREPSPNAIAAPLRAPSNELLLCRRLSERFCRVKPIDLTLWPVSLLYGAVNHLKARTYRTGLLKSRRLDGVVISVGNLTVGGTGKTPMVLRIAQRWLDRRKSPSES